MPAHNAATRVAAGPVGVAVRLAAAGLSRRASRRAARAPSTSSALRVTGPAAEMLARTVAALRDTRPDARRGRLRRNLRPATAIHDVPDLLDRRRHPQPRPGDARLRPGLPRCRRAGHPSTRPPTTCRSCSSSPRPSTPLRGGGCWSSTGCRSTCCATALTECGSPYAHTIAAVCETLPAATDQEVLRAQRLAQAGPPAEAVGLQPFTLTVPPRRTEGDR